MRERLFAVLGAICLVAVAVLVRSAIVGRDDGDGPKDRPKGTLPVVACSPTLAEVCAAMAEAELIAAGTPTLELGDDVPLEVEGWIAWDPGPSVAGFDTDKRAADAAWRTVQPLGQAKLAVAGTRDALQACPGGDPACLASKGADDLAISVGDPTTDEGLARIGPIARAAVAGRIDDLPGPLSDLVTGPADGQATAAESATALATIAGRFDLVVGPEGLLQTTVSSAQGQRRELRLIVTDDVATVVLAGRSGDLDAAELCRRVDSTAGTVDPGVEQALRAVGVRPSCTAEPMDDQRAGFLFQVKEKVG